MSKLNPFFARRRSLTIGLAYAGTVALFLWICSQFYLPGKGFTYLIEFGDQQETNYLPELRAINHFDLPHSPGYDAQHYAQIAMRPRLADPELAKAVDNLPYRARRILFCWTAYVLAGGDPVRALNIYAVQNIVCWLLLAALLWRWFPGFEFKVAADLRAAERAAPSESPEPPPEGRRPPRWGNWVRWTLILFSFGMCVSVRGALVDGPSLLLIAVGMALLESGRPWMAAGFFGISGLAKETNVLAIASLAPTGWTRRAWAGAIGRAALALLPLAIWVFILRLWLADSGGTGLRNFSPPVAGYLGKWAEIGRLVAAGPGGTGPGSFFHRARETLRWLTASTGPGWMVRGSILVQMSLTVQWLFFALRPRWSNPWWRLGAAYAVLMLVLGDAVWEGYPGAAARVLLPMVLAFNLLVPRGRGWWVVLLLGNLSVLASPDALPFPGRESFVVKGPRSLRILPADGRIVEAVFDDQWYSPDKSWLEYWRWSRGDSTVVFRNPHPFAVTADISFGLRANDHRRVAVRQGARLIWQGTLVPAELQHVAVRGVRLPPGDTVWTFATDLPGVKPNGDELRQLAFSLRGLEIDLLGPVGK